jgi:hypothetical protein
VVGQELPDDVGKRGVIATRIDRLGGCLQRRACNFEYGEPGLGAAYVARQHHSCLLHHARPVALRPGYPA